MFKVFTITIGSYLMKVGVCGENDSLPKSAGLVSVVFMVDDLDEAQSLARRLVNSMGNTYNHEVYMASDNGEVLYVGMGKHGRHKHLQSGFSHVKEANEYSGELLVEVVHRGLSRRQASKYEAEMIAELSPTWNRVQPKVVEDIRMVVEERWLERATAYYYMSIYHNDFYSRVLNLGNGSLKSGDFNKEVMTLIKEYCWNESGLFAEIPWHVRMELRKMVCGNYLTAFGLEYGRRAGLSKKIGDNGYTVEDLEKADGKVVRSFLQRLGMVVCVSRKRSDGGTQSEYATIKPSSFIVCKEMAVQEMDQHPMKDTIDALMNDFRGHFKGGENI